MENEFAKVMSERTDEELIKIVTIERDAYNPIAIEAAELEVEKRNLHINNFEKLTKQEKPKKEQEQKVNTNAVGLEIRFLNFLIDSVVWIIIAALFTFPLSANSESQMLLGYGIIFSTFIGYYAIMEIRFQKTIGKFLTKTKVVKRNGDKPHTRDILSRTFCRLIPFDRLSFMFPNHGFHDVLSKTIVIKDESVI